MENKNIAREIKLLSPTRFGDRLSLSKWTIYQWVAAGRIQSVKIGRLIRIPETELDRIIDEGMDKQLKNPSLEAAP